MACVLVSSSDGSTCLYDISTRSLLFSFRDNAAAQRGVCELTAPTCAGQPASRDYVLCAQAGRAFLHVYAWGSDAPLLRCALAEPLLSVAGSPDGCSIAGGGASGRLYLWDAASGELVRVWQGHYKAATCVAFSPCGALLASGGADGVVHAWDVAAVAAEEDEAAGGSAGSGALAAAVTWAGHSQAVAALWRRVCTTVSSSPTCSTPSSSTHLARLAAISMLRRMVRGSTGVPCSVANISP
jgi:pre-rRNA-processing protein IPI3